MSVYYKLPMSLYYKTLSHQQMPVTKSTQITQDKEESVTFSALRDIISLKTAYGEFKFPSIWLRDNCQCVSCFQKESQSRTIDWAHFDFGVKPSNVKFEEAKLLIEWPDNHKSIFTLEWLIERSFTEEKRKLFRAQVYRFERVTWGAEDFEKCCKKFNYQTILNDESVLLTWLGSLTKYGVAIVTDVPPLANSTKSLIERVAFVRKTHYGEEYMVTSKNDTTNVAYQSTVLPLHTDLPYYCYAPGVNFLHCLVQTQGQGGESHLADAFHVANYLKKNHPEAYRVLTKTLIDWNDIGHENGDHFHSIHQAPILCEDERGDLVRINYSQPQRDSHFNAPLEQIVPWYEAVGLFTRFLHSPEYFVKFKLEEGEILTFDNHRLVHGRSSYVDTVGRERLLIGCYLDWDEIYSRIRVLKKRQLPKGSL
ncbi:gamma-butyrobetaine dioxygenase-like isoform X2 [Athalia rosae]|nr:gamma-butyrobetaine dioxygenase-like isoform X2 [Athalia rosae]